MSQQKIAVIGGGKIGDLIVALLSQRYQVTVFDNDVGGARAGASGVEVHALDAADADAVYAVAREFTLVVNSCPHYLNLPVARGARRAEVSYLDLSEDVASGNEIAALAEGAPGYFVPRCGVAPGFVQIAAAHIMKRYEKIERADLRVGALPENPTNALKYNLTWSTDGLINEYGNPCEAIVDGKLTTVQPLEGYERLVIDGIEYEAFNTSGGLGTLALSAVGKARNLNYKTMRYVGHRDLMKFLLFDLKLNEYRAILKQILESAVPTTDQDQVVVLVSVVGTIRGILNQQTYTKTVRHGRLAGRHWSAIQIITASAAASVADLVMNERLPHRGYVRQEEIGFEEFCATPYGRIFEA